MSIIKILSYSINISQKNNLKILNYFLIDYSKNNLTNKQLILLNMHLSNVKKDKLYELLEKWIVNHSDKIIEQFIY